MKFLIHWLLVVFTVLNPMLANAALTDYDRQEISFENLLGKYNGGFESGKANWTASGGTFTAVTSGTNLLNGKGSFTWDASASAQTLTSQAVTIPKGYYGLDCEANILLQTPSGSPAHYVEAYDGSNVVGRSTIISSTTPKFNPVNFPCPQSGTIALRVYSNADEPLIAGDLGYIGRARNVGLTDYITDWEAWTPTGVWVSGATYTGFKRRVGTNQEIKFRISLGSAPSGTLTLNLPSECVVDTTKATGNNARVPLGNHLIFDSDTGANIYGTVQAASTTSVSLNVILTGNASTAPIANVTATVPITFASGDTLDGYFSVPCVGWAASPFVAVSNQGWYIDATIAGGNPSLGTSAVSSYTELTSASLTLTPRTGSAAAGIMCSSTNAATAPTTSTSTCAAGSESLGVNFNIPTIGAYKVCALFSHFAQVDQSEAINAAFQIVETPTNAQTLTTEGGTRTISGTTALTTATGTTAAVTTPNNNCSIFNWSSVGTKGVRLMYEQAVTGTPNNSLILADEDGSTGQRNFRITVERMNAGVNAILANSVSTGVTNGTRIEAASIDNSGSATIVRQTGSWVTSVSRTSAGVVEINYAASTWSVAPMCVLTINAANLLTRVDSITTTRLTIRTITEAGVGTDNPFYVTCLGLR